MSAGSIELHIAELVLQGLGSNDTRALTRSIERELARLLAAQPVPPALARGAVRTSLDAGIIVVAPGAAPTAIGVAVARAIHGGVCR